MSCNKQNNIKHSLLAASSYPILDSNHINRLISEIKTNCHEYPLAYWAEQHGLAPLLFHHAKSNNIDINTDELKKLRIQYLRNTKRNQVIMVALEKVLIEFAQEKIQVIILKGGALSHLIYTDQAHRPMGDIDFLVPRKDTVRAREKLLQLGFSDNGKKRKLHSHHALPELYKEEDGFIIIIDLHVNVFTKLHSASLEFVDIKKPLLSFQIGSQTAHTLGYEETLLHLCHHMITPGQSIKLISIADIIGYVIKYVDKINWKTLHQDYKFVCRTIQLLDLLTPLPDKVRTTAGLKKSKVVEDVGIDYKGWPKISFSKETYSSQEFLNIIYSTIFAPEWWLRLRYGYDEKYPIWFCRYCTHLTHIASMLLRNVLTSIK